MRSIKAFTITEARSQLSQLLKMVDEGGEIVIVNSKDRHHKYQITHANPGIPRIVKRHNGEYRNVNEKQQLKTSNSEKQQSDEPSAYDFESYENIRRSSEHVKEYAKQYYIRKQLGEI